MTILLITICGLSKAHIKLSPSVPSLLLFSLPRTLSHSCGSQQLPLCCQAQLKYHFFCEHFQMTSARSDTSLPGVAPFSPHLRPRLFWWALSLLVDKELLKYSSSIAGLRGTDHPCNGKPTLSFIAALFTCSSACSDSTSCGSYSTIVVFIGKKFTR